MCTPEDALRGNIRIVKTKKNLNKVIKLTYNIMNPIQGQNTRMSKYS